MGNSQGKDKANATKACNTPDDAQVDGTEERKENGCIGEGGDETTGEQEYKAGGKEQGATLLAVAGKEEKENEAVGEAKEADVESGIPIMAPIPELGQQQDSGVAAEVQLEEEKEVLEEVLEEKEESVAKEEVKEDESDSELCEDKKFETVLRVVIHAINNITREGDLASDVDPFVEIRANQVLLGATKPKQDKTSASIEEAFYIKTQSDPRNIKLKFHLMDQDHMTEHDLLGHGYFDLGEEDSTVEQTVHLKWKGKEIGEIIISVDFQKVVIV